MRAIAFPSLAALATLPVLVVAMPAPAAAQTVLRLAETGTVMAHPDELVASLRVVAVEPTAAAAQAKVNAAMEAALAKAKQVAGVEHATGGYSVWREHPPVKPGAAAPPPVWQASQTLDLRSHDGAALLGLVGRLQESGLAASQLGWQLSPETEAKAREAALAKAIHGLRARADAAAALLGMRVDAITEVRLDSQHPQPMFRAMAAPVAAAAAPPPSAEAADVPVSASVEAVMRLQPK
jgi:uncharacterized protein YggE